MIYLWIRQGVCLSYLGKKLLFIILIMTYITYCDYIYLLYLWYLWFTYSTYDLLMIYLWFTYEFGRGVCLSYLGKKLLLIILMMTYITYCTFTYCTYCKFRNNSLGMSQHLVIPMTTPWMTTPLLVKALRAAEDTTRMKPVLILCHSPWIYVTYHTYIYSAGCTLIMIIV